MKKNPIFLIAVVFAVVVLSSCGNTEAPSAPGDDTYTPAVFVAVAGGSFTQQSGSTTGFTHTLSSYYIGRHEVTYELWYDVHQWAITNGYTFANAGRQGAQGSVGAEPVTSSSEPVTDINWRDVIVWCNAYSEKDGRDPVYFSDAVLETPVKESSNESTINTEPGSYDDPYVNWDSNGYRLPTEGEWEYAARYIDGSNWTPYNYASGDTAPIDTSTTIGDYCWYNGNSAENTSDIGRKLPNPLNIYDMSGNVQEFCWDWYGSYPGDSTDYKGPAGGTQRIIRGGNFNSTTSLAGPLPTGMRYTIQAYGSSVYTGFRLARTQ